ncbi:MAG: hypothetical protein KA957_05440 [Syntrophaceae bacterium]|nr:hypothetical protein [Syntrophaceae bacterium]
MFGPPQTISRTDGGLNTAIGYRYVEDTLVSHADYVLRQNQIYSQAAYGRAGLWEIYGRLGVTDFKIFDAFRSASALTSTSKIHFDENWKFFGTLGAKAFYPVTAFFGAGVFAQASYNFSNFTDDVTGVAGTTPYMVDLKLRHVWDVNFGAALQATVPGGLRLYAGPYAYYRRADGDLSAAVFGLQGAMRDVSFKNKSAAGAFFGADIPLFKGFRLNIEGQYTDRFSCGSAVTYTY